MKQPKTFHKGNLILPYAHKLDTNWTGKINYRATIGLSNYSIATGHGDSAVSERDLNLETNVGSQFVEYRFKTIRSIVWQRAPGVALAICPESKERRRFSDLVNAIKCAH